MGSHFPTLGFKNGIVRNFARLSAIPRDRGQSGDVVENPLPGANSGYEFAKSGIVSGPRDVARMGKGTGESLAAIRVQKRRLRERCQIACDSSMSREAHRPTQQPLSGSNRGYGFSEIWVISDPSDMAS